MLTLRQSNGRSCCHSDLPKNPNSLKQDILYSDRHCLLDARLCDRDSTPWGRGSPAERVLGRFSIICGQSVA
jgi:hypothetical protein